MKNKMLGKTLNLCLKSQDEMISIAVAMGSEREAMEEILKREHVPYTMERSELSSCYYITFNRSHFLNSIRNRIDFSLDKY